MNVSEFTQAALAYVGGGTALLAVAWGISKVMSKSFLDQYFKKKLEDHKGELQKSLEDKKHELQKALEDKKFELQNSLEDKKHDLQATLEDKKHLLNKVADDNKFDIQRKMQDFNLYSVQRHNIYPEIYALYLDADGYARRMMGYREVPDYKRYSSKELEYSLKAKGIPDIKVEDFINDWDQVRSVRIKELNEYIRHFEFQENMEKFVIARNKFSRSKLFLSEEVISICEELNKAIRQYLYVTQDLLNGEVEPRDRGELRQKYLEGEENIPKIIMSLETQMKKELTVGDYNRL
ncbi:Sec-independent protein translocase protein TatA [Paenibacillus phyllosphaerae]|uniref:Sec-independent protein translocase protein TatA n=1 Tax=Paenibacillus phyllosphaerae TaxID=274593 RepID=A0A7W5AUP6_9BACL|nr:hypothetical protein [Paenibacillus phyllosphaerae]MBB3109115.1 Sec-independent protein translocase protein TatA [Paenibacillus phyllosphaerae]